MNVSKGEVSNDRIFCWEQVARTNRAYRVSQVFAAREDAARLLPLYALFSIIEQICSVSSDEDLARSKLEWWRAECAGQNLDNSHHPVLKEFRRTGTAEHLGPGAFRSLFEGAASRLEARAPTDISELKALCIDTQRPQYDLELCLLGLDESSVEANTGVLARGGLLQLMRESANSPRQGAYWWVPLNMLARHRIGRDALVNNPESPEVSGLMSDLVEEGLSWAPPEHKVPRAHGEFQSLRNYFAINGIYLRKIRLLKGVSPNRHMTEIGRIRIADLLVAWNCARRLQC